MSLISDLCQDEQIIAAERIGRFPLVLVPVETAERGVVADTLWVSFFQMAALMAPNRTSWTGLSFGIGKSASSKSGAVLRASISFNLHVVRITYRRKSKGFGRDSLNCRDSRTIRDLREQPWHNGTKSIRPGS
jgi:hypothetical protein